MKCKSCGNKWTTDSSESASLTTCPFCQKRVADEKWILFDNTKELLSHIAKKHGYNALSSDKYISDYSSPLMPKDQKNLVGQAFQCGAVKILQANMASNRQKKIIASKQAVRKMVESYASVKEEAVERVIWEFTNALGWDMPEPQDQDSGSGLTPAPDRGEDQSVKNRGRLEPRVRGWIIVVATVIIAIPAVFVIVDRINHRNKDVEPLFSGRKEDYYDGGTYNGAWVNGEPHGRGRIDWEDGSWYNGDWREGKRTGEGTKRWANDDVYVGGFSRGNRHGTGEMRYANGDRYEGAWSEDRITGYGEFAWMNGDVYKGYFIDGKRSGYGVFISFDGTIIQDGQWVNDMFIWSSETPSVSLEPTPMLQPSPIPTPTPKLTPSPIPTPRPSPTPSPSPRPTPTPSPSPKPTPTPSPSPRPSPSPVPSPSPLQTPVPSPVPTPEPSPTPQTGSEYGWFPSPITPGEYGW
jgi:hypothetical protein